MDFEWDDKKNKINKEKHGIAFEDVIIAFEEEDMLVKEDTRKDYGEKRYIGIGKISDRVIVVVYTIRSSVIRLISARKASKKEKIIYYERKN
ncbi:MAG: BrnT family toxin [Bacteroidales bacterium]|nr:BrnT family toxin [Bacteroidales bacterium]